ncbi:mucin-5AC-like [Puntigrus tetrazona]|uniref:mucin-5AC-like n=1 Tax=Puntigrus tetrazona TaxID=1606681 RepID=UPI001C890959|nr:mucin-5AC-like [Puntigrus tetrazona]
MDVSPVVRDIMMNRTFTIISLHFADFGTEDWVSWFTVKLIHLLPSLTAEMLQTAALNTDCSDFDIIVRALSRVFDQMTLLRQQELSAVLFGYLKLNNQTACLQKNTPLPIGTKYVTSATTSQKSTTQLPAKASTGPAVQGEVFVILQIRVHIQYIDAYSNPASLEYQTLSRNITMELNHFYWKFYEPQFLRCYLMRFWPGSVGADMQLIFKSDTVLPNKESIEDNLKSAIVESKVFLDIIPASIIVVNQDDSNLTTRQTQSSQNVLQTLSTAAPVISSVIPPDLWSTAPPNYVSITVVPNPSTIVVPTNISDTSVTTGPSVTVGSSNTTGDTHPSSTSSSNGPIAVPTQKSSITAPPGTLSTADPAHLPNTTRNAHPSTGDHSDSSITAVLTNQTSKTVGSSTTDYIEQPRTTDHTLITAVLSDTTASTGPITTPDISGSSKSSVTVGSTTEVFAHLSRTTLRNHISNSAILTDRQSTNIYSETSTSVVPADLSSIMSPIGFTDTTVTTDPSVSKVYPGPNNTASRINTTTSNYSSNNEVLMDKSSTAASAGPITMPDISESSKSSGPVKSTTSSVPINQSYSTVPSNISTTDVLIHLSRTTLSNHISNSAVPTNRQSTNIYSKTSTTVVPAKLSSTISPTGFADTSVTTGPSVSKVSPGPNNTASRINTTTTNYSSNNEVLMDQSSTTVHTGTSNTAVPTELSITSAPTASFITRDSTNQSADPNAPFTTKVTTDLSDTTHSSITADHTDLSSTAFPIGTTHPAISTNQSSTTIPLGLSNSQTLPILLPTIVPTDLSNRTVPNDNSSISGPTEQLNMTIPNGPSTTTVPENLSNTTVQPGSSTSTVTTYPSNTVIMPDKIYTTISTNLPSKVISNPTNITVSTNMPITTAPVGHSNNATTVLSSPSPSSAASNHVTTSVIFSNSSHSNVVTTSTTSSLQTTHLSTKASTGSAVQGEGFVILQIRLQRQYIDAYNNPASVEYQILSRNITIELNQIYRVIYGIHFLRCYVIRFWPGSVGVDTELIFKNQTVVPYATSIEESLKTAIAESKVFLGVIPSSITVVQQQDSTSTTSQTQTSQSVPVMLTSSAVTRILSSMLFMLLLLLLLWD